jgi:light-regulated signal transduction histidine kinase (bacteriophytochrome)
MNLLVLDIIAYAELYNFSEFTSVNLNDIVNKIFREFNEEFPDAHAKLDCDHLPAINGQAPLVKLLFHHLTGNSFKFRNERISLQITVRTSRINGMNVSHPDALTETWYHVVSISDNGIGFDQQLVSKVFTMFYRLHDKGKYHGTGTGLPICKKIMETHNGFITIESAVDAGTTVNCFFPVENE